MVYLYNAIEWKQYITEQKKKREKGKEKSTSCRTRIGIYTLELWVNGSYFISYFFLSFYLPFFGIGVTVKFSHRKGCVMSMWGSAASALALMILRLVQAIVLGFTFEIVTMPYYRFACTGRHTHTNTYARKRLHIK